jgi:hypothetical protein
MLLHNRHWKIHLLDGEYWLQPPVEIDPEQTLIALPGKNPLLAERLQVDELLPTTPGASTADSRLSRDGVLDELDQRDGGLDQRDGGLDELDRRGGDDPRAGHPHDDFRN